MQWARAACCYLFAAFGLAATPLLFWLGIPLIALWGLAGPATQSLMSRGVGATEQGRLQGAIGSLRGIAELVGPGIFSLAFARFIRSGPGAPLPLGEVPGAPFLLAALFLGSALALAWHVTRRPAAVPARPAPAVDLAP